MGKVLSFASKIAKKILRYEELKNENESLRQSTKSIIENEHVFGWPNGHFYSPVHNLEDLDSYEEVTKSSREGFSNTMPGFSEKKMLKKFNELKKYFKDFDYPEEENGKSRFYIENSSYPITDALMLFAMIKTLKPKRIIEIGSGFTSALMMDVNERFFNNKIDITFIEPYPELLISRMSNEDKKRYQIIPKEVQDVPVKKFMSLGKGDILFIDSTHVSKFNSDVNYELFNILPNIKTGVTIHFHDVFDGFEYPLQWLKNGWAWNEDYLLRSYLMDNRNYEILLMNDYLVKRHPKLLKNSYNRGNNNNGGSLWMRKL